MKIPCRRPLFGHALRRAVISVIVTAWAIGLSVNAQIVGGGANAPSVIHTPNGLPQVDINRPGNAGVSLNTYRQFDVQKPGAILNNSPVIVGTQQAGVINGNPNFRPGDAARIIVNQVQSNDPSSIRGFVEVAGKRAEVVIANPAGLSIDGGGFINTSRAVLTTGVPNIGADGALNGFDVSRGLVTVAGSGLNTENIDQVDLIARAVRINAEIYAKRLNVVAGANRVDHDTLANTPIQGDGDAPGVVIDVALLGGMYANRVYLVGNAAGVGVSNAGVIEAQAGDLTLLSDGRLVNTGKLMASGDLSVKAGEIRNGGSIYAQGDTQVSAGAIESNGLLAAQGNVDIEAASLHSTGGIGAGVNGDGVVTGRGDLHVAATGELSATGHNLAGGNMLLMGGSVSLAGSRTVANSDISVTARAGDVDVSNGTASAGGRLAVSASGAVTNDGGSLSSQRDVALSTGSFSNRNGTLSSQGKLLVQSHGGISNRDGTLVSQGAMDVSSGEGIFNQQGIIQSAGRLELAGSSLDNTAGRVTSLPAASWNSTSSRT